MGIFFGYTFDRIYKDKRWIEAVRDSFTPNSDLGFTYSFHGPKSINKVIIKIYGYFLKLTIISFLFLIPIYFFAPEVSLKFIIFAALNILCFASGTLMYFRIEFYRKYMNKSYSKVGKRASLVILIPLLLLIILTIIWTVVKIKN
jgi:hypothetical protein